MSISDVQQYRYPEISFYGPLAMECVLYIDFDNYVHVEECINVLLSWHMSKIVFNTFTNDSQWENSHIY